MFPIAWAIVEGETKASWLWFLRILSADLCMGQGYNWTIISDQQKGLVPAIHEVWPEIEHRQCARHIYSNWRKIHTGRALQKQFWRCVKVTTQGEFATETESLKKLSQQAFVDFMARDPNTFCKSHFKTHSKCDVVDNNMSETFNSFILLARYKPIISMLEDIRLALMDRMQKKVKLREQFVGGVAPRILKKMQEAYDEQTHLEVHWNGQDDQSGFEVKHKGWGSSCDVNLANGTCTCRVWDLTGIPCCHVIAASLFMRRPPEIYLSEFYTIENYMVLYCGLLSPVEGSRFWNMDGEGMILPPHIVKRKLGRPKVARRRDPHEGTSNTSKASRAGVPHKCSNCRSTGHTRRNCPNPLQPDAQVAHEQTEGGSSSTQGRKFGRPKGSKNVIGQSSEELARNNAPTTASLVIERRAKRYRERVEGRGISTEGGSYVIGRSGGRGIDRGRGRGRGRGRSTQPIIPEGFGLWQGEDGQMAYRGGPSQTQPTIIADSQNNSQVLE